MNDIIKKLSDAWVPTEIISNLQDKLGESFQSELMKNWLYATAQKLGIDTSNLPNIDFTDVREAFQELSGTDIDWDGKTGIGEAIENIQEAVQKSDTKDAQPADQVEDTGFIAKIKSFFS